MNESQIIQIENSVNEDNNILSKLKQYSHTTKFNLKPGHKSTILSLPQRIEAYLKHKKETKAKNRKQKKDEIKNEIELKSNIREKLSKYMEKKLSYSVEFSDSDIIEFESEEENQKTVFRCKVKCKFCSKSVAAKYETHWIVSNVEAHLKKHVLDASNLQNSVVEK